jgi:hypothetical protein
MQEHAQQHRRNHGAEHLLSMLDLALGNGAFHDEIRQKGHLR